jgi:hypothetical protein
MSNDVATMEKKNELAPTGLGDPFSEYADAVSPQFIIGDLLKFSKGDYFAGINNQTVPAGTTFTVNLDELMAGFVRWWDGKPTDHVMVRVADHIPPKKRIELGDSDEQQWETDINGKRRDPWQFTNYLPMMNEKGELFTFTTSSRGGISAIAGLARRYANHRKRHPDVFPLIALGVDSYQHPNREFGRIKFPVFAPAGYAPKKDFLAALAAAGIVTAEPAQLAPAQVEKDALDDMLNDEIPY